MPNVLADAFMVVKLKLDEGFSTMKKVGLVSIALTALTICFVFNVALGDEEKPKAKYTVKEVMKIAHKDKLQKKVESGEASDKEKAQLLDAYLSLLENKPPRGEKESWHELSGAVVVAAAKVVTGRDGAIAELKKATNCKNCHSKHKPASK